MFGGSGSNGRVNEVYIFNLNKRVHTTVVTWYAFLTQLLDVAHLLHIAI